MEDVLFNIACWFDNIGQWFAKRGIRLRDERVTKEFPKGCEVRIECSEEEGVCEAHSGPWFVVEYDASVGSFKVRRRGKSIYGMEVVSFIDPLDLMRHFDA
jgi:hypothetical protein